MSTVRFTKDHGKHKAGDVASVPYGAGRDLVAAKVAEYPPSIPVYTGKVRAPASTPESRHAADIKRLNEKHARDVAAVKDEHAAATKAAEKDHDAAVKKLTADLDAANQLIAELNAKKK